eukprot:m.30655 g.30655  ORF g.30655 m.30655 type:complete len:468 (-) comp9504_c0_seq1:25-1428(-)
MADDKPRPPEDGTDADPRDIKFPHSLKERGQAYNELPTYPVRPSYTEFELPLHLASQMVAFDGCPHDPHHPANMPIYQTATFVQPSSTVFGPYDYTRSGNPTRTALEKQVALLEHAHAAFAFNTGMAALNVVTRTVEPGGEILVGNDIYGGMHRLLTQVTIKTGVVKLKIVDMTNPEALQAALTKDSRLVHLESPSNPLMKIADIRRLVGIVRECEREHGTRVLLSVDNTMMSPYLQNPLRLGADIVVHSGTKFLGGHSDVTGGVVCVNTEELAKRVAFLQNAEGTALAPFPCWLFLRGIKTLAVRAERQQNNAAAVATFLQTHPAVVRVNYAGLPPRESELKDGTPVARRYAIHMSQARGGGSVISFETGDVQRSRRFVDACKLFKITVSFGSCNSLVEMPGIQSHASIPAELQDFPADLVRLSIGIEDWRDLLADLGQALHKAMSGDDGDGGDDNGAARSPQSKL